MNDKDFQPPTRAELQGLDPRVDKALQPIHDHLQHITRALQGRLTFGSNMQAEVRDLLVRHDEPVEVTLKRDIGRLLGILRLFEDRDANAFMRAQIIDGRRIRVTYHFTDEPAELIPVRLLVVGGD